MNAKTRVNGSVYATSVTIADAVATHHDAIVDHDPAFIEWCDVQHAREARGLTGAPFAPTPGGFAESVDTLPL